MKLLPLILLILPGLGTPRAPGVEELTLRGDVVCLDEAGQPAECSRQSRFALRDAAGRLYHCEADDTRTPIFADPRVRSHPLEVHVWKREGKLEIIRVYSIINGELYLPHYFCDVCNITSYTGGDCWCCQKEFEFRETKVKPR